MKQKDPYLEELEELGDLEGGASDEAEEPTKVDLEVPAGTPPSEEVPGLRGSPAAKEIMGLAPDIPVQVVVVMGKKSVTVKELLSIRMGQVIDMDRLPTEPVDLVAGGKIIGKGELVEVDGKLGVRILKLLK